MNILLVAKRASIKTTVALLLGLQLCHVAITCANVATLSDNLSIYYQQSGSGSQVILFIPGWTMSSKVFEYQLKHFQNSTRYKAIAIDPRGQGLSTKADTGHTYAQRGRDLAAFIDQLNINNIILVGWSFGTLDMLSYINQFGISNVKAMMILDGSPKTMGQTLNNAWVWIDQADSNGDRQMITEGMLTNARKTIGGFVRWMLENPSQQNVEVMTDIALQTPAMIAALTNETASYANYEETLKSLNTKIPIYLFVREQWAEPVGIWRQKHLPSAKFSHMGKHLMFWERPDEFNQYLDAFLNEL